MIPISGVNSGAVRPLTTSEKVLGAPKIQTPEEEAQGRPPKPVMDEYVRSQPQALYQPCQTGKDEDSPSKLCFDSPPQAAQAPKQPDLVPDAQKPEPADQCAKAPEKKDGGKEARCVGNTSKVDREIEMLKKKLEELEQRLNTETDEAKIKDLERQRAQVERELKQKDNDTYRKQHTTFTQLP